MEFALRFVILLQRFRSIAILAVFLGCCFMLTAPFVERSALFLPHLGLSLLLSALNAVIVVANHTAVVATRLAYFGRKPTAWRRMISFFDLLMIVAMVALAVATSKEVDGDRSSFIAIGQGVGIAAIVYVSHLEEFLQHALNSRRPFSVVYSLNPLSEERRVVLEVLCSRLLAELTADP